LVEVAAENKIKLGMIAVPAPRTTVADRLVLRELRASSLCPVTISLPTTSARRRGPGHRAGATQLLVLIEGKPTLAGE